MLTMITFVKVVSAMFLHYKVIILIFKDLINLFSREWGQAGGEAKEKG